MATLEVCTVSKRSNLWSVMAFCRKSEALDVVHHSVYSVFNRSPHGAELYAVMPCVAVTLHFFCVTMFIVFLAGARMVLNCTQKYLCVAIASFLRAFCCLFGGGPTFGHHLHERHSFPHHWWCCVLDSFVRITAFTFRM